MSWRAIARKDFLDSVRSRTLWALVALFVGLLALIAYAAQLTGETDVTQFVGFTSEAFALFVPLVSVVLGYKSVVDERESGTIALALSFPHTRAEFVAGKFAGRSLVLAIPVLVGMLVASALVVVLYDSVPVFEYLVFTVLSVVLGISFLAIAIGLSMLTTSGRRVTAGAFGAYIVLGVLWSELIDALVLVLWRFDATILASPPEWATFAQLVSPVESYHRLVAAVFDIGPGTAYTTPGSPWFVDAWVAALLLFGWVLLALGVGYLRFARSDL